MDTIPFLDMFPCCLGVNKGYGDLDSANVLSATVSHDRMSMTVQVQFPSMPAPAELTTLEWKLAEEYGLRTVILDATWPGKNETEKPTAARKEKKTGSVLMGKAIKGLPTAMSKASPEQKTVIVSGKVFAAESRAVQRLGASVLQFDMTDGTGSVRVSKFIPKEEDQSIVGKIAPGMYLTVSGAMKFNNYSKEVELEPRHIQLAEAPALRPDNAPVKRVELHLHTQMSTMDALTDPAEAVKRAAAWGMPAVAITDHGVAQAFPAASKAAKGVKVIYGMEGYYINDIDEAAAVRGEGDGPVSGEYVAFDIETTGLSDQNDRITEIGAVVFGPDGKPGERFQTFVNPGMHIPPDIQRLTGITDRDVFDAPEEGEAVGAFLDFVAGRPLCAHNADFDVGFISAAAERMERPFQPLYIDTLALAQALLPDLRKFKLDVVSDRLGLPGFRHHRASDDALVCGRILQKFVPMLQEKGADRLSEVNDLCFALRKKAGKLPRTRHISLLVRNRVGLKNLYELISKSHLEHFRKVPIIPKSLLIQHREGLLIGSACEAGEFFQAVARNRSRAELRRIGEFYDYFEIMPIANNAFMLNNGMAKNVEQLQNMNRRVIQLADELGKPVCATGDVHFMEPEDEIYRHILLSAKKFSDADQDMPLYFRNTEEMLREFDYLGEEKAYEVVVTNTNLVADMIEGQVELLPEHRLYPPVIENSAGQLKDLVYGRLKELYGDHPEQIIMDRVEHEMDTILGRHFDVIYMSAQKLVADSNAHGYLVGSRGSVGSSLVAYLSGITEVNSLPAHYLCRNCYYTDFESGKGYGCGADMPDKICPRCGQELSKEGFDIPFATFLGIKGDKVPDIDLNFSGEYQAQAHAYTRTLFGADHVFKAGTVGTIADKTAFGYVKMYAEERGLDMNQAEMNRLALGLVGVKRTTGQHPGGLVIIPQDMDVTDFCPVQHPADDPGTDIVTTHLEYHFMEDYLLKLDELGHDNPTMINMLEKLTGTDAKTIRLDDPETMSLFSSPKALGLPEDDPIIGQTGSIGIPEFGTGFTRQMLVDTKPDKFDMLVRLSGYSHGTGVWLGNAQDLIRSKTASVSETIGCRDDIMLYLMSMGIDANTAFKSMENVRKKNKQLTEEQEQAMRDHNVPEWYIESCHKIEYLFPKAHAVAYVLMAFRIAWYKVHYPLAFYSALFYRRSQKDGFDAAMMTGGLNQVKQKIKELKAVPKMTGKEEELYTTLEMVYEFYMRGFEFAPIDLYKSDAFKFLPKGDKMLRVPFVAVSGLGDTAAMDLARAREGKESFVSVEEVAAACPKVSSSHIEALRKLGAFGDMPETSQMTLFDF
ncbi:MAG: PolC-type DNA polymerase III [Oscillospiraceae bacterium]|nr:PolC-type DNA polymerase III [Oscillospiraceae bacterium]